MISQDYWYIFFGVIILVYIGVLIYTKDKRYLYYMLTGIVAGFYFDVISVSQNYYIYYPYPPVILGVPLTVTLAEGASIAIMIFVYKELILKIFRFLKKG